MSFESLSAADLQEMQARTAEEIASGMPWNHPAAVPAPGSIQPPEFREWLATGYPPPATAVRVSRDRLDRFFHLQLSHRLPGGLEAVAAARAAARDTAEKLAGEVLAAVDAMPEGEQLRAARQARDGAQEQVRQARAKVDTIQAEYDALLRAGENPARLVAPLTVARGEAEATAAWASGIDAKHDQAAARYEATAQRVWSERAEKLFDQIAARNQKMRSRCEQFAADTAADLMECHLLEAALRKQMPKVERPADEEPETVVTRHTVTPVFDEAGGVGTDEVIERRPLKSRKK
jgi:hypothetical protein